jgi:hypothetical protein
VLVWPLAAGVAQAQIDPAVAAILEQAQHAATSNQAWMATLPQAPRAPRNTEAIARQAERMRGQALATRTMTPQQLNQLRRHYESWAARQSGSVAVMEQQTRLADRYYHERARRQREIELSNAIDAERQAQALRISTEWLLKQAAYELWRSQSATEAAARKLPR